MSKEDSLNAVEILQRFKKAHGITKDIELARLLGIKRATLAMWKKRNYVDLRLIALHSNHSLDYIIKGNDLPKTKDLKTQLHELELENAELRGQIKILKELLLKRNEK